MVGGTLCQRRRFRCRAARYHSRLNSRRTSRYHPCRERPRFHSTCRLTRSQGNPSLVNPASMVNSGKQARLRNRSRSSRTCPLRRAYRGTRHQCNPPRSPGRRHPMPDPAPFMHRLPQRRKPNQPHSTPRVQHRLCHHRRCLRHQALHIFPAISQPHRLSLRPPWHVEQARWRSEPRGWVYGC
jgi:hypothetical protein